MITTVMKSNADKQAAANVWLWIGYLLTILLTTAGFMLSMGQLHGTNRGRIADTILVLSTIVVNILVVWL